MTYFDRTILVAAFIALGACSGDASEDGEIIPGIDGGTGPDVGIGGGNIGGGGGGGSNGTTDEECAQAFGELNCLAETHMLVSLERLHLEDLRIDEDREVNRIEACGFAKVAESPENNRQVIAETDDCELIRTGTIVSPFAVTPLDAGQLTFTGGIDVEFEREGACYQPVMPFQESEFFTGDSYSVDANGGEDVDRFFGNLDYLTLPEATPVQITRGSDLEITWGSANVNLPAEVEVSIRSPEGDQRIFCRVDDDGRHTISGTITDEVSNDISAIEITVRRANIERFSRDVPAVYLLRRATNRLAYDPAELQ